MGEYSKRWGCLRGLCPPNPPGFFAFLSIPQEGGPAFTGPPRAAVFEFTAALRLHPCRALSSG